jgi:L-fuconolactonase
MPWGVMVAHRVAAYPEAFLAARGGALAGAPVMSPVVDAHQHFWTYGTYQTSWMEAPPYAGDPAFRPLRRSFQPEDLIPELRAAGVHCTVTIEAADYPAENAALLANARAHEWIAGVVGWVPLAHPRNLERVLDAYVGEQALVGIRHLINVEPDPDWIIRPDVLLGLQVVAARGLTFDYVGILPRHLEHVPVVARCIPDLRIVIDHLGKPPIAAGELEPWGSLLARAARMPNVFAKLSGLDTGRPDAWTVADIAPYIDRALELFGPERLMFGSDWPVADLRGGYGKVWRETSLALACLSRDERDRILGGTAVDFYRLTLKRPKPEAEEVGCPCSTSPRRAGVACHAPPRGVRITRRFSSSAMQRTLVIPAARTSATNADHPKLKAALAHAKAIAATLVFAKLDGA